MRFRSQLPGKALWIDPVYKAQFPIRVFLKGFIMISTVDQIAADTGAKSLTGVLMSQDHKRIRAVRRGSRIRRIYKFAGT